MKRLSNADLTLSTIPPDDATWQAIAEFALTIDGYEVAGSFEECAKIANHRSRETLDEIRICLFFEQRRWRHFGMDPDAPTMEYIRSLITDIRRKVVAGDTGQLGLNLGPPK